MGWAARANKGTPKRSILDRFRPPDPLGPVEPATESKPRVLVVDTSQSRSRMMAATTALAGIAAVYAIHPIGGFDPPPRFEIPKKRRTGPTRKRR